MAGVGSRGSAVICGRTQNVAPAEQKRFLASREALSKRFLASPGSGGAISDLSGHSLARRWVQFWPLQEPLWTCSGHFPGCVVASAFLVSGRPILCCSTTYYVRDTRPGGAHTPTHQRHCASAHWCPTTSACPRFAAYASQSVKRGCRGSCLDAFVAETADRRTLLLIHWRYD